MAINLSPNIGEESCMKCNEKIEFAMFAFDGAQIAYGYNSEDDFYSSNENKPFEIKGWVCYNCALENDWTDGTSLEGAKAWCTFCEEILNWDDGNGCLLCEIPYNIDEVFCDKCWCDDKLKINTGKDENASLESIHKHCE